MNRLHKSFFALALTAGGTLAYGQAQERTPLDKDRRDPTNQNSTDARTPGGAAAQPGAGGAAQPAGGGAAAADAHGAGAAGHAAMAQQAAQVDQQVRQEMMKIQQSPQGALDKLFLLEAGLGGNFEMAFAQQAMQKSQSDDVRQLARTILQDHQQAHQQLMQVAQAAGVQLPQGLDSMHAQKLMTYAALEAKDYDKKYLCKNNELHAKDVEAFKTAAAIAQNPQVKQFAAQTLPKLQQHHQQIQQVGQKHGAVVPGDAQPASGRLPGDRPAVQPQGVTPQGQDQLRPDRPGESTTPGSGTGNTPR